MKSIKNNGVSLIVLVITIIVIIILAGIVILNLNQSNTTDKAKEAVFKSDVANFKADLGMYHVNELGKTMADYDGKLLDGDKATLTYDDESLQGKTMVDAIPLMNQKLQYTEKFIIFEGKLVYVGNNSKEIEWSDDLDIPSTAKSPVAIIELPNPPEVKSGTKVTYTIRFSAGNKISNFKKENITLLTEDKQSTTNNITIGELSGTDTEKTVEVAVDTTNLEAGKYMLQVKSGTVADELTGLTNKEVYSESFTVDNTAPGIPEILVEPTSITNGNVTITINYSEDSLTKQYKIGTGDWQDYTTSFVIEENVDIIARAINKVSTETLGEVLAIRNIDKQAPTITLATTSTTTSSITVKATATDVGTAGLDTNSYEYSKDDGVTWTTPSSNTTYTFENLVTGTYKLKARVKDKATNVGVSSTISEVTKGMETLGNITIVPSTTAPTNQNITVTINYPTGIEIKQYKIGSGSWQNYTGVLTITENTDILAKGMDAGGNVLEIADALSVRNIDKQAPTITLATTATTTSSITLKATASDVGTAGINTSSYEYSKDDGLTWTTPSSNTTYTFENLTTGTYKLKARVKDKATNVGVSSTLTELTKGMETLGNITIVPSTTAPTNQNITVTINYPTGIEIKQYKIGSGNWQSYTGVLTITENTDILAKGMDAGGNVLEIADALAIRNIDKVNPNAASISATSSNGRVTGTISVSDNTGGSGIDFTNSKYVINTVSTTYGTTASIWSSATTINTSPKSISESKSDGTYYVHVLVVDKAGNKVVSKSSSGILVSNKIPLNEPELAPGMTPIKWDGTDWINTTPSDPSWHNYGNKQWANAKTADGSMWVWLPRYEYKIQTPHIKSAQRILVNFKTGTTTSATSGYILHPAFTFGTTQLTGIWIAKFEASGSADAVNIIPGVEPLRGLIVSQMFTASRNMETNSRYGWGASGTGIDTHLMKNVEWGAAAYLASSIYGKDSEVATNCKSMYFTGGGSGKAYYLLNTEQSTTGNITGIYDMNGGIDECTAAYVINGHRNLNTYGSSLMEALSKYKDVYLAGSSDEYIPNYEANSSKVGDAVYETSAEGIGDSSWYSNWSNMPYYSNPFFNRGGHMYTGVGPGIFAFGWYNGYGDSYQYNGFRTTLAVGSTL